ncbi:MAG: aldo/keto reductase [Thermoguttaceae bacterium]|nr:aldo/keto reductase [Thermoguttaceae bacterium]
MQMIPLGKSGISTSVVALGTWGIGGWMWGGAEERDSISAIHSALDHGINLIDTAPLYGFGYSEEVVGKALLGRRDKAVLATKCGIWWEREPKPEGEGEIHVYSTEKSLGTAENYEWILYRYLRPDSIRAELERSLKLLQTDYVDLYQVHCQDVTSSIAETMETLLKLKEEGKIRAIGVSNVTPEQLAEYQKTGYVDVLQERFSLVDREVQTSGMAKTVQENEMNLLSYAPLAHGLLTGNLSPDETFPEGDFRSMDPRFAPDAIQRVNEKLEQMHSLTVKYGLSMAQLVIAWTFSTGPKTNVLCGARTAKHAAENALAGSVRLAADDLNFIDSLFGAR